MPVQATEAKAVLLCADKNKQIPIYPKTKTVAVSDENGKTLKDILKDTICQEDNPGIPFNKITTLYNNGDNPTILFPRTKTSAVTNTEGKNIEDMLKETKPIVKNNIQLNKEDFQLMLNHTGEEDKLFNLGFQYRANILIPEATETMLPNIIFSLASIEAAGISIAGQIQSYQGGVYIYADSQPEKPIEILSLDLRKVEF